MIRTTRGARRLVAALVAVLLTGIVGLVSAVSVARVDAGRTTTALADADGTSTHHRATAAAVQAQDDHTVAVDLPATVLGPGLSLLAAALTAVAAARIATRHSATPTVANGRAPPRG